MVEGNGDEARGWGVGIKRKCRWGRWLRGLTPDGGMRMMWV